MEHQATLSNTDPTDPTDAIDAIDAVVIGASAGGIEALSVLLPRLPADFGPAVIVVLHLPPDGQSSLAALFGARCMLPVFEANDRSQLTGGTIHFAPPGYHLLVNADRRCALSLDEAVNFSRPSIDVLFESAAWAYGPRLLGVLLTGASADGAAGLAKIREMGGHTWAQTPESARATAMPEAAIALGVVDEILDLESMAQRLSKLHRRGAT